MEHLNYAAGIPPFLRGPLLNMYVSAPGPCASTQGFRLPKKAMPFTAATLSAGQKGFRLPSTWLPTAGYDSDHERVIGDVGKAGVAIDSILDMKILFDQIPSG
jgi:methylmalonyl-CoA mutase